MKLYPHPQDPCISRRASLLVGLLGAASACSFSTYGLDVGEEISSTTLATSTGSQGTTAASDVDTSTDGSTSSGTSGTSDTAGSSGALQTCGDGVIGDGEACDDGNLADGDGCTQSCTLEFCGDGVMGPGEGCDDGNLDDGDACDNLCQVQTCGDHFVQETEVCDDGMETPLCDADCTAPMCGDGLVNYSAGEECDDGNNHGSDGCTPACTPLQIVDMAAGPSHQCIVLSDGAVRCWGSGFNGKLGRGDEENIGDDPGELPTADIDVGGPAKQVCVGDRHTCVLLHTGKVRCWGGGASGQLGSEDAFNRGDKPGQMPPPDVDVGAPVLDLTCGYYHTCVRTSNAQVRCWGDGLQGALGSEDTANIGDQPGEMPPADVPGIVGVAAVQAAFRSTCVLSVAGQVRCWGSELGGWLGDQPGEMPPLPIDLGPGVVGLAAGALHGCVILADGGIRCWGDNADGQLGYGHTATIGDDPGEMPPPLVNVGGNVTQMAIGLHHTCARLGTGEVRCWGYNYAGFLGYGHTIDVGTKPGDMPPPAVVIGGEVTLLSRQAEWSTCARLQDGTLRCWGDGAAGILGYGDEEDVGDDETPSAAGPVPF